MQLTNYSGCISGVLNNHWTLRSAVPSIKGWKIDGSRPPISKSTDGYPLCLQIFESSRDIQEALTATADHSNWGATELSKVSGNIHCVLASTMHTTEPASPEYLDSGSGSKEHGPRDGSTAVELAPSETLIIT
jgi:hypothetical protein